MEVFARWWNAKLAPSGLSVASLSGADLADGHVIHQLAASLTGGVAPARRPSQAGEQRAAAAAALDRVKARGASVTPCTARSRHPRTRPQHACAVSRPCPTVPTPPG